MSFSKNIKIYRESSIEFNTPLENKKGYIIKVSKPVLRCNITPKVLAWYDKESGVLFFGTSDWVNIKDFYTTIRCYKNVERISDCKFKVKRSGIELCDFLNVKLTKTLFKNVIKDFITKELKTYETFKLLQTKL